MKRGRGVRALLVGGALVALVSGCSSAPSIVGVWEGSDGTPLKTIDESGRCEGMYYNQGEPLDIGGPMTCALGSEADDAGFYMLVVSQGPNTATYAVAFSDSDTAVLRETDGTEIVTLERR